MRSAFSEKDAQTKSGGSKADGGEKLKEGRKVVLQHKVGEGNGCSLKSEFLKKMPASLSTRAIKEFVAGLTSTNLVIFSL